MCSPIKEKPGLVIGTKERPADVFLPQFSRGKDYVLDFAVTNPLSDYMIQQSRASSKDACVIYADLKINKYNNNIKNPLNVTFQPMIVDAFGKWETTAKEVIHIVAARLASRNNTDIVSTHRHFHQKLSVILQKSNVRSILSRIPVLDVQRTKYPIPPKSTIGTPASHPLPAAPRSQNNQWSIPPTPKTSSPHKPSSKSLIKSPADKNNPPPTTPPMKVPVTAVVPVVIVNNDAPVFPEICTSVNPNYGSNLNVNVNNNVTSIAPFNPICIDLTNVVNTNTVIDTHFSTAPLINMTDPLLANDTVTLYDY